MQDHATRMGREQALAASERYLDARPGHMEVLPHRIAETLEMIAVDAKLRVVFGKSLSLTDGVPQNPQAFKSIASRPNHWFWCDEDQTFAGLDYAGLAEHCPGV